MPMIIAVATQKGGAGKTMITELLAGEFAARNMTVGLIDMDWQKTLTHWVTKCRMTNKLPVQIRATTAFDVKTLKEEYVNMDDRDVVILDMPGQANELLMRAIHSSHFVLIPVRAHTNDTQAAVATVKAIQDNTPEGQEPPVMRFVFNAVTMLDMNAKTMMNALDQIENSQIKAMDVMVTERPTFKKMADGEGTLYSMDAKDTAALKNAKGNIKTLVDQIDEAMNDLGASSEVAA